MKERVRNPVAKAMHSITQPAVHRDKKREAKADLLDELYEEGLEEYFDTTLKENDE